jgi:hypothetical protein
MFKKKSKNPNRAMLKEGLLCEGGGLNADALAKLNKGGRINGSEAGSSFDGDRSSMRKSKSKLSDSTYIDGLENFKQHGDLFQDLTLRSFVDTNYDVINIIITYDSQNCIAIVNKKDEHFEVQGYSLTTYQQVFKKCFDGEYIKMNLIEQSDDGKTVAIAWQNNGKFKVNVIATDGTELDEFDVSAHLNLDDESKPITGFWEPLITSVFVPGDGGMDLFIVAYHRIKQQQYSFKYSYREKKVLSGTTVSEIKEQCTPINFPLKSFYSTVTNNCYTFYR